MGGKTKVLVVDDDEIVRLAHQRSLKTTSCSVETAWNGDEALRAMEREPFDVILLDLRMPGTDGLAVLEKMKREWPDREVIVITGYPTLATAKEAVRLGAYDYLAKPVGPAEVVHATNNALQHKRWALHRASSEIDSVH